MQFDLVKLEEKLHTAFVTCHPARDTRLPSIPLEAARNLVAHCLLLFACQCSGMLSIGGDCVRCYKKAQAAVSMAFAVPVVVSCSLC